jgi:predicted Zn finger-like uncharacterized protein
VAYGWPAAIHPGDSATSLADPARGYAVLMYTQCPNCLTVYRIQAETLAHARGEFRCGYCGAVFDGLERLVEKLPETGFQELPEHPHSASPIVLAIPAMHPKPHPTPRFHAEPGPSPSWARQEPKLPGEWLAHHETVRAKPAPISAAKAGAQPTPLPAAVRGAAARAAARPARAPGQGAWWAASVVLALSLAAQIGWSERERLLEDDRVRPWLDRACAELGCTLPMRTALSAIRLQSREVRPHPNAPKALRISASMINDAAFVQRFPAVEVVLSDLTGRPVAMRRFLPEEYLADPGNKQRGFPPGTTTPLVFDVVDPGREAVAFEFRFLEAP